MTRDERTQVVYDHAKELNLWCPIMRTKSYCRKGDDIYAIECGEVYSDYWHVKVFDDGTYQLGWLELRNGTTLVCKNVQTMDEVKSFLKTRQ